MDIRSIAGLDTSELERFSTETRSDRAADNDFDQVVPLNLQEEINDAAEEMADILSAFGRFSKVGRNNDSADNDYVSSILEENADEKLDKLINQVTKLRDIKNLLNFARQLFPNDSDLMNALREMLRSRKLSELQKKRVKEAIADLEKFSDVKKMHSGLNVARLAKKYSDGAFAHNKPLSAQDLRNSYLNFIELELPAGFIYKDWVDEYGYENRSRLLAFTLSALIADMKANEPGIHIAEFGPLSSKLSDARILHTLDLQLNEMFETFPFKDQIRNQMVLVNEGDIIKLYLTGLVDAEEFKIVLKEFSRNFMRLLLIKQRGTLIQSLGKIYNLTPGFLFINTDSREVINKLLSSLLQKIYRKEKSMDVWDDNYRF